MTLPLSRQLRCEHHYRTPPQLEEGGAATWIARGVNIVTTVTEARAGAVLGRDNPDEYMAILCPGVAATFTAGEQSETAEGPALIILPPGDSRITVTTPGRLARIFTTRATDLTALAPAAEVYAAPLDTAVAPLADWPAPADGFRIRVYPLDPFENREGPRIQPRIFRSTNLMVNAFVPWRTRRDPREMSPHWHADFEQVSLGLQGEFVHHIRYPWGSDSTEWLPDEHLACASPSAAIIPPPAVHTTQDVGEGEAWLIDVFAPPRIDFASKPGFVLNEADYPLPESVVVEPGKTGGALLGWQKSG